MSTTDHPVRPSATPPLIAGQTLDRATFHARYAAMPAGVWAELIDGKVVMASPVSYEHGREQVVLLVWACSYEEQTPGVECLDNASTVLSPHGEVQPDLMIRISEACGGQTRVENNLVHGAPEFVAELSRSTRSFDLGPKRLEYERAGVREYVVRCWEPDEVRWHVRREGKLVAVAPDAEGLHRSEIFPGLWLDPAALLTRDTRRLRAVVEQGCATPEHEEFVRRLHLPGSV